MDRFANMGYWEGRITAQLEFARELSKVDKGAYDELVADVEKFLESRRSKDETITKDAALAAEEKLSVLAKRSKEYRMICVSHAHIDMNWMWRWDETVSITLDTFRTMLRFFDEYPKFTFSQSQASVYKIVADYAPEMLEKIKELVHAGRWEVTASTWVEADKNMPEGESLARHVLYTKNYLSELLEIEPDSLRLDFEPDTFGHSLNVPEVLADGGVKYYYHCRGMEGPNLYNWIAPSGRSILVYREPLWYNDRVSPEMILFVPEFCQANGVSTMLKVYGVGDHGGGPTRRDIERIIDMQSWPVCPQIDFGHYTDFFEEMEKIEDQLPNVEGELNTIFTGCYTSQSRIKMGNRIGQKSLKEAELFTSAASILGGKEYPHGQLSEAWRNVFFNQFHDILPGSCTPDAREHALGLYQETLATSNSRLTQSFLSLTGLMDTASLVEEESLAETISEGAGVGFGVEKFKIAQTSRGAGKTRVFTVFNPSPICRTEPVEIVIWDWNEDLNSIMFKDHAGNPVKHQVLDQGYNHYWTHYYLRVLVFVSVPAYGYSNYVLEEDSQKKLVKLPPTGPRLDQVADYVLENEFVKATFDPQSFNLVSLVDKATQEELVDGTRGGGVFRLVQEDDYEEMTSWRVGRYMDVQDLVTGVKLLSVDTSSPLRQELSYSVEFSNSALTVKVRLDAGSSRLDFDVDCTWLEVGKRGVGIPQLNYHIPVTVESSEYRYDVPFGTVTRAEIDKDVPANSWALPVADGARKNSVMLISKTKHGFRGWGRTLGLTLIRSSYDPDPFPELGEHHFEFALEVVASDASCKELIETAALYNHPVIAFSPTIQSGDLALQGSFFSIKSDSVVISSVKGSETSSANEVIVRVYETGGKEADVLLKTILPVKNAYFVDLMEEKIDASAQPIIDGQEVRFSIAPFRIAAVCLEF